MADVIEKKSPPTDTDEFDANSQDYEEQFHIQLNDLANSGTFGNQALIPVARQRRWRRRQQQQQRQRRSKNVDDGGDHESSGGGGENSENHVGVDNENNVDNDDDIDDIDDDYDYDNKDNKSGSSNCVVLSREQRKTNIIQHLLNENNSRYELNLHKLFGLSRNFLKSIFNDFIFEHWVDGKLLVKQQRMLGDIPSSSSVEATLTEIVEEGTELDDSDRDMSLNDVDDEILTPTNQSGMSVESNNPMDPLEAGDDSDLIKIKPKPVRKTKLYTCFQCPKV